MKRAIILTVGLMTLAVCLPWCGLAAAEDGITFDERLSVFLADIHVNGRDTYTNGKPVPTGMRDSMKQSVDEILAMNPRPRYVFVFGDIAYLVGRACDYTRSKPELKRLTDAGIRLTLGLGNHDHRAAFFDAWPEYRERTLVSNEVVTVTKMPDVELIMLDTLDDCGQAEGCNQGKGILPEAQQAWVKKNLRKWKRPFLLGAHHHVNNLALKGKKGKPAPLADFLMKCPKFRGFVHGHSHRWVRTIISGDFEARPHLTLPSNGCNGDIGYVLFRTTPEQGVATLVQKDYFHRHHRKLEGRPATWAARMADNVGVRCTFPLKAAPSSGGGADGAQPAALHPWGVDRLYLSHVHRGGGKFERPDNTLKTFVWCWENGSALECDCRRTKDGVGIMLHDGKLKRTGRGIPEALAKKSVSKELSWDEIRNVDVGSYLDPKFSDHRIPTIRETFAAMKGHPTYLCFVDEKGAGPEYIANAAVEAGVQGQVYYTGKSHEKIFEWNKILPGGKSLLWIGAWPKNHGPEERARADRYFREAMQALREKDFKFISAVSIHTYYDPTDPVDPFVPSSLLLKEIVQEFHLHGIPAASIPFQGGEREETYMKLWDIGFDCFSTDYPSVMFGAIGKLKQRGLQVQDK